RGYEQGNLDEELVAEARQHVRERKKNRRRVGRIDQPGHRIERNTAGDETRDEEGQEDLLLVGVRGEEDGTRETPRGAVREGADPEPAQPLRRFLELGDAFPVAPVEYHPRRREQRHHAAPEP